MTNYQLNEPVVEAVLSRLNTSLVSNIATLNAAVTDGFTIDNPFQVLGYMPSPAHLIDFPTIGIRDGRSRFEDDNGYSATGVHSVVIACFIAEPDLETLTWKLRRYEQAVVATLLTDSSGRPSRSLGTANDPWGIVLDGTEPGPTIGAKDPTAVRQWMSWVAIGITAKRDEL